MSKLVVHLGTCPVCKEGSLGVRVCGGCEAAFVLCDECDALWESRELPDKPTFPSQPEAPCPHCEASLYDDSAHWATVDELDELGWSAAADEAIDDTAEAPNPNDDSSDEREREV